MEIIRQTEYLSNIPLQKKLATLEELYHRPGNPFSVHELCDALDVARGTFYNHIFRKADRSQYQEEQAQLMLKVKQVFDDSEQRFGAEKIRIVLAESGIRVGKKRISAIMQELGLCSVRTDAKKQFKRKQQYAKQNLLKREFSAEHPNQIWVSDITYFKVKSYWVCLCIILDLYRQSSRKSQMGTDYSLCRLWSDGYTSFLRSQRSTKARSADSLLPACQCALASCGASAQAPMSPCPRWPRGCPQR